MSVTGVNNNSNGVDYYKNTTSKAKTEESFSLGIQEKPEETCPKEQGEVPSVFCGMSFADLFCSSEIKRNQIPVVNQIVSSRNPEDGEIYLTCFTDNKITCCHTGGKIAWEVEVNEDQQRQVKDYFKEFTPYKWAKELYSGDNMGMAAVKNFWLKLFEN